MNVQQIDRKTIREKGFPEPVSISSEVMESLSGEQGIILATLANLSEKGQEISEKIESKRPTRSGVLVVEGPALTVCEDDDDWKIITAKEREKLESIKKEIIETLNKALDSGLGFLGLIQRECAKYSIKP